MKRKKRSKIDKTNDFGGLADFISKKFDDMEGQFGDLKKMFRDLQGSVDAYAKRADTYFQEMVMLSHQIARHERWIRKIAERVGVKLDS